MAGNLLGTDIVILSTDTYRKMLAEIEALKKQIETYEKAFEFKADWADKPELHVDIAKFEKAIKQAWNDYEPEKDTIKKNEYVFPKVEDWWSNRTNLLDHIEPEVVEEVKKDAGDRTIF